MDDAFLKQTLETERQRTVDLNALLQKLETAPPEEHEEIVRDIGNKTLNSCGGDTGITGIPLILDICYPCYIGETVDMHKKYIHKTPEELGTTQEELFNIGKTLVRGHLAMTFRIYAAYDIDLAAKGYTGQEADDMAFYLSRKETYYPWHKTPSTGLRKFLTIFDMFDVYPEDVGLTSTAIHAEVVRFYQIWIRYLSRRDWDSLVKHIISERFTDHGQIGILASRLSPAEVDPAVATMLLPDGNPINKEVEERIASKFGSIFKGNNIQRLDQEAELSDDEIRARQLRYVRHAGRLNPHTQPAFYSLVWGAERKK